MQGRCSQGQPVQLTIDMLKGDSGDPLLMKYVRNGSDTTAVDSNSKPWYLLGIVSFGACVEDEPVIFTRFSLYLSFRPYSLCPMFTLLSLLVILYCSSQNGELHTMDPEEYQRLKLCSVLQTVFFIKDFVKQ